MCQRGGRRIFWSGLEEGIVGCGERGEPHRSRDVLCANAQGFSLHAGGYCAANDRQDILQLPWRNGTTHIVLTPMEFMQRLAALTPRPRLHLIRVHGVLAQNAKLRSKVVPVSAQQITKGEGDCEHEHSAPARMTWVRLLKRVFDIDIEQCACGDKINQ